MATSLLCIIDSQATCFPISVIALNTETLLILLFICNAVFRWNKAENKAEWQHHALSSIV